jgi:hypothetical protein
MRNYSIWVSGSKSKQKCKANLLSILCNCFNKDVCFEKKEVHYVLGKVCNKSDWAGRKSDCPIVCGEICVSFFVASSSK